MNARVNWLAVVVAAVVYFVIGALWYSMLFGNAWMIGIGKTEAQIMAERPNPTMAFVITFICNLILSSVLAQVIVATGKATAMHGMRVAFIAWAGFIATTLMMNYQFEVRTFTLWAINAGYPLIGMLIMGGILGSWTKKDAVQAKMAQA
jgi:hypothetical protein